MKIALCLSGHSRTYGITHEFWKTNLLSRHDVDVFVHAWESYGPRWFGEGHSESTNPLPRKDYASGIVESPLIDINDVKNVYNPMSIVVEEYSKFHEFFEQLAKPTLDERDRRGIPAGFEHHHPLSIRSMLYKRYVCNQLKLVHEELMGRTYDAVIQCRPDVALTQPIEFALDNLDVLHFHNSRSVTKDPELCDFGVVGSSKNIDTWCELYHGVVNQLEKAKKKEDFFQFLNPHKMYVHYLNDVGVRYVEEDLGLCIVRDTGIILGWPHAASIVRTTLKNRRGE